MTKKKHGLKGKASNNPNGKPAKGNVKKQVGVYVDERVITELGGKDAVRAEFLKVVEQLQKK